MLAAVVLAVVGCGGETEPATNVASTSATLNAEGRCDFDAAGTWWWEGRQGSGAFQQVSAVFPFDCPPDQDPNTEGYQWGQGPVALSHNWTGLSPSTSYQYRLCADPDIGDPGCVDANGTINGTAYDSFTTQAGQQSIPPVAKRVFFPFDSNYSPGQLSISGSVWSNSFQGGYLRMVQNQPVTGSAQFDRVQISNVGWGKGRNVWYGGRFRLEGPASNLRFTTFVAGDDFPNARLGVVIENAEGVLITTRYGGTQRVLGRFALPLGTDFKLDIHQILHEGTGALNEVYINDQRVVNTTTSNLLDADQRVNNMRYGYVSQSGNSTAGAMRLYEAYLTEAN